MYTKDKIRKAKLTISIFICGFCVNSVIFPLTSHIYHRRGWLLTLKNLLPADFSDFYSNYRKWTLPNPDEITTVYRSATSSIDFLPFWNLYHSFFTFIDSEIAARNVYLFTLYLFIAISLFLASHGLPKSLRLKISLVFLLFSYPVWFDANQANVEFVSLLLLCLSLRYFSTHQKMSSVLLAFSAAVKPFSALLFLTHFKARNYRNILIGIRMYFFMVICIPIYIRISHGLPVAGALNFHDYLYSSYGQGYIVDGAGLANGSSLYGGIKSLFLLWGWEQYMNLFLLFYFVATSLFACLLLLYLIRFPINLNLEIVILLILGVLLPFVSGNYKLLYVLVAIIYFIKADWSDVYSDAILVLLSLSCLPMDIIERNWHSQKPLLIGIGYSVMAGSIVRPILLTTALLLLLISIFRSNNLISVEN